MDKVLYFVGAGLTKSLQKPARPVPMMNGFVNVMADYLDDDVILTTVAHWDILDDPPYRYSPQEPHRDDFGRAPAAGQRLLK